MGSRLPAIPLSTVSRAAKAPETRSLLVSPGPGLRLFVGWCMLANFTNLVMSPGPLFFWTRWAPVADDGAGGGGPQPEQKSRYARCERGLL